MDEARPRSVARCSLGANRPADRARVTTEELVGSLPVEENGDTGFASGLHDAPLRVDAGRAERLPLAADDLRDVLEQPVGRGQDLMVLSDAGRLGHRLRVTPLVSLEPREASRERVAPVIAGDLGGQAHDRRGIDAAAERRADGDIGPKAEPDRVAEQLPQRRCRFLVTCRHVDCLRTPVALNLRPSVDDPKQMRGRELLDPSEEALPQSTACSRVRGTAAPRPRSRRRARGRPPAAPGSPSRRRCRPSLPPRRAASRRTDLVRRRAPSARRARTRRRTSRSHARARRSPTAPKRAAAPLRRPR